MQKYAIIHYRDKNFKILHVFTFHWYPLTGVCKYKNKLCIFEREFDEENIDIYLIPFKKRIKILLKFMWNEFKKRYKI